MDDEIRIRISDIIFALQKNWKLILATTIAGMLFGLVLTAMSYVKSNLVTYNINGSFAVSTMNEMGYFTGNGTSATNVDYYLSENMVAAIRYVLNSRQVVETAIEDEKLIGIEASDIQHNVSISQYGETQIVEMTLAWRSPEEGINIWNAIINAGNRIIPKVLQLGTLVIINEPKASQVGISRAGPKLAVMLSGLGFMAGIGFALISMLLHPTLNNLKDVDAVLGLETIGMIPQSLAWSEQNGNILARNGNTEVAESFSAATYILRNRLGSREKHRCFYITSTTSKEGKSAVAANIAIQLSGMECHTLLIDFDTRNPDIGAMFLPNIDYASSLNALYRGEANEYDVITRINGYLDLLPMIPEHNPIPLDGTIEDFFTGLVNEYEYVVINASPVGMVSETLSLNQITNNVLFVVGFDAAPMSDIQASLQKMDKSGARVIGCIVNGVKGKLQDGKGIQLPFLKNKVRITHHVMPETSPMEDNEPNLVDDVDDVDELINLTEKMQEKQPKPQKGTLLEQILAKTKRGKKTASAPDSAEISEPSASNSIMAELISEEPEEPDEAVEPVEEVKPVEPVEEVKPAESVEEVEPVEQAGAVEPVEQAEEDDISDSETVSELLKVEDDKSFEEPKKKKKKKT